MLKLLRKIFLDSFFGLILLLSSLTFIGLLYLIPYLTHEQAKKDAFSESQRLTTYIRMFRTYYNSDILSKIKKHTDLKVNFNHKDNNTTVPLPATLVHDLGLAFTQGSEVGVQMYSNYPFPNRESRVLDRFQKDALAFILKNPDKTFSREEILDGEMMYRTSFPDFLSAPSCVSCHNTRADTPKNDWKLGDVRGVIEVSIPMQNSLGSEKDLTFTILLFILFNFLLFMLFYFFQMKRKNKKLEDAVDNKDKILSEYKKAVDLGTIVSKANKQGLITYVNDAFVKVSGYSREELIGQNHSIVRHEDSESQVFKELWEKILNKEVWRGDLKNKAKDGSSYFVHATIVPILNKDDEIMEFLAIRYETTQLHEAVNKANIAEKAKGDFLANMSHELRTPLNAIIGFSQILQRRNKIDEKDMGYVNKIQISGQNLLTLVNSILDFSKIEEGQMELFESEVNIYELFYEINILIETQAKEKNISISLNGFDKTHSLYVDKQLIKQAFVNILSNAVKFTGENGKIEITYTFVEEKHHFTICDNGIGISPDDIKGLFDPFKQGKSAQNNAAKGTGLGLAITKKIITQLHKGEIKVQSEENKGTCFSISL